jgi:hypothetical protein
MMLRLDPRPSTPRPLDPRPTPYALRPTPYDPYENAIGRGASLLVDVSMPDATDPKGTCAG